MKTAFLFPGQGAQKVGMGRDLYESNADYKQTFDSIDSALSIDLKVACFDGINMDKSEYVQPAIYAHSISIYNMLGIKADVFAGLSLGEYSALAAGGVMDIKNGAALVNKRGHIMDNAVPKGVGSMVSIIGMDIEEVESIIANTEDVWAANHLSEKQIVLGGRKAQLDKIVPIFDEKGARTTVLNVSGPFHTQMLYGASQEFKRLLNVTQFNNMDSAVYSNYTGKLYTGINELPECLAQQMCSRVRWHNVVENMLTCGITRFIEVGPSMVLSKMLKRRTKGMDIEISSIRDAKTYNKFLSK